MGVVLVVAAHPDDEVLGCGGTISRLVREGHNVHVLLLGDGVTSRYPSIATAYRNNAGDKVFERQEKAREVGKFLGIKEVEFGAFTDNRFDGVDQLTIVKFIEDYMDLVKPTLVFTHHHGDLNIDHRITHEVVRVAIRNRPTITGVFAYEILISTDVGFVPFMPTAYFELGKEDVVHKIEAMSMYEPNPKQGRSPEDIMSLSHMRAGCIGCRRVEAFELIRMIR